MEPGFHGFRQVLQQSLGKFRDGKNVIITGWTSSGNPIAKYPVNWTFTAAFIFCRNLSSQTNSRLSCNDRDLSSVEPW